MALLITKAGAFRKKAAAIATAAGPASLRGCALCGIRGCSRKRPLLLLPSPVGAITINFFAVVGIHRIIGRASWPSQDGLIIVSPAFRPVVRGRSKHNCLRPRAVAGGETPPHARHSFV